MRKSELTAFIARKLAAHTNNYPGENRLVCLQKFLGSRTIKDQPDDADVDSTAFMMFLIDEHLLNDFNDYEKFLATDPDCNEFFAKFLSSKATLLKQGISCTILEQLDASGVINYDTLAKKINIKHLSPDTQAWELLCMEGSKAAFNFAIEHCGLSERSENNYRQTVLHIAALTGNEQLTALLIKLGADIEQKDVFNKSPLYCALSNNHLTIADLLLSNGAEPTNSVGSLIDSYMRCALSTGVDAVKVLARHHADINQRVFGESPVRAAIRKERWQIAKFLLDQGSEVSDDEREEIKTLILEKKLQDGKPVVQYCVGMLFADSTDAGWANVPSQFINAAESGISEGYLKLISLHLKSGLQYDRLADITQYLDQALKHDNQKDDAFYDELLKIAQRIESLYLEKSLDDAVRDKITKDDIAWLKVMSRCLLFALQTVPDNALLTAEGHAAIAHFAVYEGEVLLPMLSEDERAALTRRHGERVNRMIEHKNTYALQREFNNSIPVLQTQGLFANRETLESPKPNLEQPKRPCPWIRCNIL